MNNQIGAFANKEFSFSGRISAVTVFGSALEDEEVSARSCGMIVCKFFITFPWGGSCLCRLPAGVSYNVGNSNPSERNRKLAHVSPASLVDDYPDGIPHVLGYFLTTA